MLRQFQGSILVVDDDPDVLWALKDTIDSAGAECLTAGSAAEAVEIYQANATISLIITDIWMPDHDGDWLIAQIRRIGSSRGTPPLFIKMTGYLKEKPKKWEMSGQDVVDFLVKPFTAAEIRSAIERSKDLLTRVP